MRRAIGIGGAIAASLVAHRAQANVGYGTAIAVGDFDHFGAWDRDEMAVGAPYDNWMGTETGDVTIYWRDRTNRSAWHWDFVDQDRLNGAMFTGASDGGDETSDNFGSVLAVGDFDGDGFKDLAIGVPGEDLATVEDAGCVHILYGATSGPNGMPFRQATTYLTRASIYPDVVPATPASFDRFGAALAAGDFNGDGLDDLAVGAPGVSVNGLSSAGAVFVFYSQGTTFPAVHEYTLVEGGTFSPAGTPASGEQYGTALAAGNFNGDLVGTRGIVDLAVGAPWEQNGYDVGGAVYVYYGTSSIFNQSTNYIITSNTLGAYVGFGASLVAADFNEISWARYDDLGIGAPFTTFANPSVGAVHVLYGSATGFNANSVRQYWQPDNFRSVGGCSSYYYSPQAYGYFGYSLAAGDVMATDNGGCQGQACNPKELVIGAPYRSSGAFAQDGEIYVLKGNLGPTTYLAPVSSSACFAGPTPAAAEYGSYGYGLAVGFLGDYPSQALASQQSGDIASASPGIDRFSIRYGDLNNVSGYSAQFPWPW